MLRDPATESPRSQLCTKTNWEVYLYPLPVLHQIWYKKPTPFVCTEESIFLIINKKWERTEISFQFPEGRCVQTAVCDTVEFPRLPHRANWPTGGRVLEEQMDRSDALGHLTQSYLPVFRQLNHLQWVHTVPAELRNNPSRKCRMCEVHTKANVKKSALSLYWKCGSSHWKCSFHLKLLVLDINTAFLKFNMLFACVF